MNTLKPLLIFAALIGVCYGVYSRINHKADTPPPEAMAGFNTGVPEVTFDAPGDSAGRPFTSGGQSPSAGGFNPPAMSINPNNSPPGYGPGGAAHSPDSSNNSTWQQPPAPAETNLEPWQNAPGTNGPGTPAGDYAAADVPPNGGYGTPAEPYTPQTNNPNSFPADPQHSAGGPTPSAFAADFEMVRRELDAGRLAQAHYNLSRWYDDPSLTPAEHQQLNELLDQLAGTVIYSTQNLIEPAHEVQPGETMEQIAQRYSVPWQLLTKINGIEDPNSLRPGERLKVVRGPFSAVISLEKKTMTLMLNGAYAGRFQIGVGRDYLPQNGQYFVTNKMIDPVYHGPNRAVEAGSPDNPYGRRWIGLGGNIGIHGTNDPQHNQRADGPGSISLGDRDVDDVFDILSEGSKVTIRR